MDLEKIRMLISNSVEDINLIDDKILYMKAIRYNRNFYCPIDNVLKQGVDMLSLKRSLNNTIKTIKQIK